MACSVTKTNFRAGFGSMDEIFLAVLAARLKDRAFWLEACNGNSYSVVRVSRGSTWSQNLSVSILGGDRNRSQFAVWSKILWTISGFLPAFAANTQLTVRRSRSGNEPTSEDVDEYAGLVNRLHKPGQPNVRPRHTWGQGTKVFSVDDGAQTLRQELECKRLELQQCEAINGKLAAHIGKYNGLFARLCVVWHCVESRWKVAAEIVSEATRPAASRPWCLLPHAVSFYANVLGLSNDHDHLTATAGIHSRPTNWSTSPIALFNAATGPSQTARNTEALFEQLDALGWISRTPGISGRLDPAALDSKSAGAYQVRRARTR